MQTAIITGASRGIGEAIANRLYNDGYRLVIFARSETTSLIEKHGWDSQRVLCVQGDIADPQHRAALVTQTVERFGRIDVLVNNAGVAPKVRNDLLEMTEESFDFVVGINVKANLMLTQLVAKQMIHQAPIHGRKGTIVNISSCSAYATSPNRGEYCVSKAGVAMLTQLFAHRLAAEEIPVFEIRPGIIATDMTAGVTEKYNTLIFEQDLLPIARWGQPEDVADGVSLLCDNRLRYATGEVLNIDGGFHIQRL